jgi:acetylornithine deacetylase/succinyl-diaminopimelate desuccinylase-like protein
MSELLETGAVARAIETLGNSSQQLADTTAAIAAIPAPTSSEAARAAFVNGLFAGAGYPDTVIDGAGNVRARLAADPAAPARTALLVCAHLDAAYPAGTDIGLRREGPMLCGRGVGDNASGIAVVAAVMREIARTPLSRRRPVVFAATVGEEGQGGLKGIRSLMDDPDVAPSEVISVDGRLGAIVTRAIAVRRFRISVKGPGGHSWADHGRASANVGLVRIANALSRITPPAQPRTTLNIGVIKGGSSVNAIAAEAYLDLDLRSEDDAALADLQKRVMACFGKAGSSLDVQSELIDERPSGECSEASPLVRDAERALRRIGLFGREVSGSTEANIPLSRGVPAVAFGAARIHDAHASTERVEVDSLGQGAAALYALLVLRLSDPSSA